MTLTPSQTSITRRYHFEAAHFLPYVAPDHKCRRMHGHNYVVEITTSGPLDHRGFVVDFAELDLVVAPLVAAIDHRTLNEIRGLENPTAELIATWFLEKIDVAESVRVFETPDCWAEVFR